MNNTQLCNLSTFDIEHTSAELKKSSANLIKAMDIIQNSITQGGITNKDMETLKTIDISFYDSGTDPLNLMQQNAETIQIVCDATIRGVYERTVRFYGGILLEQWMAKENEYKTEFVKIGREVSFIFDFLQKLRYELLKLVDLFDLSGVSINPIKNIILFDFLDLANKTIGIIDLNERKQKYINALAHNKMIYFTSSEYLSEEITAQYHSFIEKCTRAIEIIDYQIENSPLLPINYLDTKLIETTPDEKSDNTKDFTTRRQVLAMYYLLNELDKSTHQIDRTVKARFIEFLTGKNYDSIYKTLSNLLKGLDSNNPQNAIKDMEYIKSHFENLGLKTIVQKITNDMSGAL